MSWPVVHYSHHYFRLHLWNAPTPSRSYYHLCASALQLSWFFSWETFATTQRLLVTHNLLPNLWYHNDSTLLCSTTKHSYLHKGGVRPLRYPKLSYMFNSFGLQEDLCVNSIQYHLPIKTRTKLTEFYALRGSMCSLLFHQFASCLSERGGRCLVQVVLL